MYIYIIYIILYILYIIYTFYNIITLCSQYLSKGGATRCAKLIVEFDDKRNNKNNNIINDIYYDKIEYD